MSGSAEISEAAPSSPARRHFHVCLAAILLPIVSVPVEWVLALGDRSRSDPTPEDRTWTRRLVALAVADSLIGLLLVAFVATGHQADQMFPPPSTPGARPAAWIGVQAAPGVEEGAEARIAAVLDDSPAARAGLRAGDVVLAVDGEPVSSFKRLREIIGSSHPGVERVFRVARGDGQVEVRVTPESPPRARAGDTDLLRPQKGSDCGLGGSLGAARGLAREPRIWLVALLIAALWLWARRARPGFAPLWGWVVLALGAGAVAGAPVAFGLCLALGGPSLGGTVLTFLANAAAMLAVGLIAKGRMRRAGLLDAQVGFPIGAVRAVFVGFFYLFATVVRVELTLGVIAAFWRLRLVDPERSGFGPLLAAMGWDGKALLILTLVIVGPIAEEVLFRGVILPRLSPLLGAGLATVLTSGLFAVLHLQYGFGVHVVFLYGLMLSWARLRTGGLSAPIVMHMVINALATVSAMRS